MYKREEKPTLYIITGHVDFRCGINRLALMIQDELNLDPYSNSAFIFTCKRKDKLKILYWGGSGFWLLTYALDDARFRWLKGKPVESITYEQFEWLLNGMDLVPKHYISASKPGLF